MSLPTHPVNGAKNIFIVFFDKHGGCVGVRNPSAPIFQSVGLGREFGWILPSLRKTRPNFLPNICVVKITPRIIWHLGFLINS